MPTRNRRPTFPANSHDPDDGAVNPSDYFSSPLPAVRIAGPAGGTLSPLSVAALDLMMIDSIGGTAGRPRQIAGSASV